MHRIGTFEDPTLASRYECKYQISPMVVSALREFIQPFMRPDPFAALREDNRYPICSLYLDSEDLVLYQQTVGGHKNRFKLRVRSYSDDPRQVGRQEGLATGEDADGQCAIGVRPTEDVDEAKVSEGVARIRTERTDVVAAEHESDAVPHR